MRQRSLGTTPTSLRVTIHAGNVARLKPTLGGPNSTSVGRHLKPFKKRTLSMACECVCVCVARSDSTATLIHDSPPAVREYLTPFPISTRLELCCYRNIDSSRLNIADFLNLTGHKKLKFLLSVIIIFSQRKRFGLEDALKLLTKKLSCCDRKCRWVHQKCTFSVFKQYTGTSGCLVKAIMSLSCHVTAQYSLLVL